MQAEQKGREKRKPQPLQRYNILVVVTILAAFLLLASVYTKIIFDSAVSERMRLMNRAADEIATVFYERSSEDEEDSFKHIEGKEDNDFLRLAAAGCDAVVWMLRPDGRFMYLSGIPREALDAVRIQSDGTYSLPVSIPMLQMNEGLNMSGGRFLGVFSEGEWLSVVRPLYNQGDEFCGTVQLHVDRTALEPTGGNVVFGLALVMLVALLVAFMIVKGYVKRMAAPIDLLSEAAGRVAKGDYSARVNFEWDEDHPLFGTGLPDDDLINLVRTFNRMIEQIEMNNTEQRDFVASITHDLRTPLTSIGGFVTAMLDGTIPPEKHEHYLKVVQDETRRLTTLVGEMREMMSFDAGHAELDFVKFDINKLIGRVISNLEVLLNEKNISVQTDLTYQEGQPILVEGDEEQIERVLYNIISNAVKFANEDGIISVSTRRNGPHVLIVEIEDDGPGIREEDLPHVFDRFFKGDRSRTNREGSGLGLYICRRILQSHGQNIYACKSQLGGAKFEFTLPLA